MANHAGPSSETVSSERPQDKIRPYFSPLTCSSLVVTSCSYSYRFFIPWYLIFLFHIVILSAMSGLSFLLYSTVYLFLRKVFLLRAKISIFSGTGLSKNTGSSESSCPTQTGSLFEQERVLTFVLYAREPHCRYFVKTAVPLLKILAVVELEGGEMGSFFFCLFFFCACVTTLRCVSKMCQKRLFRYQDAHKGTKAPTTAASNRCLGGF